MHLSDSGVREKMILCDIAFPRMQDDTQNFGLLHPVIHSLVLHVGVHQCNLIMA